MRLNRTVVAFLFAGCTLVSCGHDLRATRSTANQTPIELTGTLEPLRDHFNSQSRLPRAVLLLSPT